MGTLSNGYTDFHSSHAKLVINIHLQKFFFRLNMHLWYDDYISLGELRRWLTECLKPRGWLSLIGICVTQDECSSMQHPSFASFYHPGRDVIVSGKFYSGKIPTKCENYSFSGYDMIHEASWSNTFDFLVGLKETSHPSPSWAIILLMACYL